MIDEFEPLIMVRIPSTKTDSTRGRDEKVLTGSVLWLLKKRFNVFAAPGLCV